MATAAFMIQFICAADTGDYGYSPVFQRIRMKPFCSLIITATHSQLCWACGFLWGIMRSEPVDTKHPLPNILYLHTVLSYSTDVSGLKLDFIAIIGFKGWNNCGVFMFSSCGYGFPQGSPASSHNSNTWRLRKLVNLIAHKWECVRRYLSLYFSTVNCWPLQAERCFHHATARICYGFQSCMGWVMTDNGCLKVKKSHDNRTWHTRWNIS